MWASVIAGRIFHVHHVESRRRVNALDGRGLVDSFWYSEGGIGGATARMRDHVWTLSARLEGGAGRSSGLALRSGKRRHLNPKIRASISFPHRTIGNSLPPTTHPVGRQVEVLDPTEASETDWIDTTR